MASSKAKADGSKQSKNGVAQKARCIEIADRGVSTGKDFAKLMSLLIGDIATGRMRHQQATAICNAGGKLLKVVELQHKYGKAATAAIGRDAFLLS